MEGDWKIYLAKVAALVGAYYGAAKLGLSLTFETESVTAVWPPTGIALAALVIWATDCGPAWRSEPSWPTAGPGYRSTRSLASRSGTPWKRWRVHGSCTALPASNPRSTGSGDPGAGGGGARDRLPVYRPGGLHVPALGEAAEPGGEPAERVLPRGGGRRGGPWWRGQQVPGRRRAVRFLGRPCLGSGLRATPSVPLGSCACGSPPSAAHEQAGPPEDGRWRLGESVTLRGRQAPTRLATVEERLVEARQ